MIRSLYTSTSGMLAGLRDLDVTSNNLANVDKAGFKRDRTIFKSFPELLLRRVNDNGLRKNPIGSYDIAPVVGKLGTGVEVNEVSTDFSQGNNLRRTDNQFDFALAGKGFFAIETDNGVRYTRNGTFTITNDSFLVTKDGFKVLDSDGNHIQIKANNFRVLKDGTIVENANYDRQDLSDFTDLSKNDWANSEVIARLKVVNFYDNRELKKEGNSFFRAPERAGQPMELEPGSGRPEVLQGFFETSNVNPVTEMVNLIKIQRTYEANQKVVKTSDEILGRVVNEVGR